MSDLKDFEFKCSCCGEIHKGMPSLGSNAPNHFYSIPKNEVEQRVFLNSDTCVIDREHYFVRGCLEFSVVGYDDIFSFGAWVSLSKEDFKKFESLYDEHKRDYCEPMFGWFSSWIWPFYEDTENIKSRIHLRNEGIRPFIEIEKSNHPLALAQAQGISPENLVEIYEYYVHGKR